MATPDSSTYGSLAITPAFPATTRVGMDPGAASYVNGGTSTGINQRINATNGIPQATYPSATTGANDPQIAMYKDYRDHIGSATTTADPALLGGSLRQNVYDPWGPVTRPEGGRQYQGPWVDPWDAQTYDGTQYRGNPSDAKDMYGNGLFKYNQMLMTVAQNFDPFMQKKEMARPHWWLNRIPRTAYKLFNGAVQETRIYRGGLSVYAGLYDWEDLAPDPTKSDACAPMKFRTYQYAWETRAWSGKKTAWGSDPICLDIFRFTPHAIEQLGWILETGVKFGTDIQNIWNRDMFIYHSVMAGRSYVMTSEYRGADSPRFIYEPYCKFGDAGAELVADRNYVSKPFVVFDATSDIEPVNFDVLNIFRQQLIRNCPEAAVGRIGNQPMFAIAISEDDVWNHIRGNEELRRYWIEANPQALIDGWISPTTYRNWTITCDGDQLRFKFIRRIASYTEAEAKNYGYVGYKELAGKPVCIAEFVPPEYGARAGVNGAPIPEANPEYDLAELAIAPIFMNHVFTNQFVPDTPSLGHGTWFGPKKGLNGRWGWFNPQTKENLEQKVGNFYGIFEIVPKPETNAIYASSFLYRRCAEPLPSLCPAENPHVNVTAKGDSTTVKASGVSEVKMEAGAVVAKLVLEDGLVGASTGDQLVLTKGGTEVKAVVFQSLTGTKKAVQLEVEPLAVKAYEAGSVVFYDGKLKSNASAVEIAEYAAATAYEVGDLISHDGKVYKVTTAVTAQGNTEWADLSTSVAEAAVADIASAFSTEVDLSGATVTRG